MAGTNKNTAKPRLHDVTGCAADSAYPALAARALELCLDRCDFADAILFSDTKVEGRFRHVAIDRLNSIDDYSRFYLHAMPSRLETEFALVVQWDGSMSSIPATGCAFRKYDYIGGLLHPKEGGTVVGNGGFSLRSRKLLKALPTLPVVPGVAEDVAISISFRKTLERDFGIRFAPPAFADRFSYEVKHPGHPTFGFHGPPNFLRHEEDAEIIRIFASLPPRALISTHFFWLLIACLSHDRVPLGKTLYAMIRQGRTPETIVHLMTRWIPREFADRNIAALEPDYVSREALQC